MNTTQFTHRISEALQFRHESELVQGRHRKAVLKELLQEIEAWMIKNVNDGSFLAVASERVQVMNRLEDMCGTRRSTTQKYAKEVVVPRGTHLPRY